MIIPSKSPVIHIISLYKPLISHPHSNENQNRITQQWQHNHQPSHRIAYLTDPNSLITFKCPFYLTCLIIKILTDPITLTNNTTKRIASPFPAHLPKSLPSPIPITSTRNHLPPPIHFQLTYPNKQPKLGDEILQTVQDTIPDWTSAKINHHSCIITPPCNEQDDSGEVRGGGAGILIICLLKLSLHQSRPTGYSRLQENISVGREERPYFNKKNPFSLDEIECCQYRLSLYCSIMHESLHALYK